MYPVSINTPQGIFTAWYSNTGLARLDFPQEGHPASQAQAPTAPPVKLKAWTRLTESALLCAISGQTPKVLPPLDLSSGSSFQQNVWQALLSIPAGQTRHYSQLAGLLKKPQAARAVGTACGANPIPVLVPCHRVLPKAGGLGGFSGGRGWKERLLQVEGAAF